MTPRGPPPNFQGQTVVSEQDRGVRDRAGGHSPGSRRPSGSRGAPAQRLKCDDTLKPGLLTPEFTPAEFDAWKRDFQTYFLANRLDAQGVTIAEQRLRLSN